jgi:hypothetical protein
LGLLLLAFGWQRCSYSFSGAVLSSDVKTVYVGNFSNQAELVIPSLAQEFSDALRDRLLSQTNLKLVGNPEEADLVFEGAITGYQITPVNIASTDQPRQNRLTITVLVNFVNKRYPEYSWEKTFTNFADFDATQDISQIQREVTQIIHQKLTQDIFNSALSTW